MLSMDTQHLLRIYRTMTLARRIDQVEQEITSRGEAFFQLSGSGHEGTAVLAVLDGEVKYVGEEPTAFGKMLLIKHADKHITVYAHMQNIDVKAGMKVEKGRQIGTLGQTGRTESPQLFFQVRYDRQAKNPLEYLSLEDE